MSHTTQSQAGAVSAPNPSADTAQRLVAAEVLTHAFTSRGWVPKLRWLVQPAIGTKLYTVSEASAPEDTAQSVRCIVVAEVTGTAVSYGSKVPQLRWLSQPEIGAKLYQDVTADTVAPGALAASGADYKGHENLAEMLVTHLDHYRRALKFQRGHAKDADDRAWFDHELAALLDIETACNADIKAARAAKANATQQQGL